jgi:D-alanine-D-alanine ligase
MREYEVAVIFGGISNENEISVITGTLACNVLKNGGKSVLPFYIAADGKSFAGEELSDINKFKAIDGIKSPQAAFCNGGVILFNRHGKPKEKVKIGCVLNCCHGGFGEGGGVSGMCGINNIPLASARLFESAAFMDKYYTKIVLKSLGVKVAPYEYLRHIYGAIDKARVLGYPVIVKPCKLGSSIGVQKAESDDELLAAVEQAFELDDGVLLEKYFGEKREINCAAYFACDKVITSECEESVSAGELLSYDDKYAGYGKSIYPAKLNSEIADQIKTCTVDVYSKLNMRGIVRFDYLLCGEDVYLSEINTVPGSLSYYLLASGFKDFYNVLDGVITQAKVDFVRESDKLIINTGIINNFSSNACKIK